MPIGLPPHGPVDINLLCVFVPVCVCASLDVDVLNKQRHQQVKKEQELKQQAAVQWEFRDLGVTDRFRRDEVLRGAGPRDPHSYAPS